MLFSLICIWNVENSGSEINVNTANQRADITKARRLGVLLMFKTRFIPGAFISGIKVGLMCRERSSDTLKSRKCPDTAASATFNPQAIRNHMMEYSLFLRYAFLAVCKVIRSISPANILRLIIGSDIWYNWAESLCDGAAGGLEP